MRTATFAGAWAAATGTVTAVSIAVGRGDALSRRSSADPAGSLASHGADGASSSEEPGAGRRAGGAETASGPSRDGCAPPPSPPQRLHSQAPEGPRVSRLCRCVTSSPDLRGVREPRLALRWVSPQSPLSRASMARAWLRRPGQCSKVLFPKTEQSEPEAGVPAPSPLARPGGAVCRRVAARGLPTRN